MLALSIVTARVTQLELVAAGGGRKIIRVEVSVNGGESWELAELAHGAPPTEYGKHWAWCLWQLEVDVMALFTTKEIAVRAWDASMNTQPDKITWNVMVRGPRRSGITCAAP